MGRVAYTSVPHLCEMCGNRQSPVSALWQSSHLKVVEPEVRLECPEANESSRPFVFVVESVQIHCPIDDKGQFLPALGNCDVVDLPRAAMTGEPLRNQLESGTAMQPETRQISLRARRSQER